MRGEPGRAAHGARLHVMSGCRRSSCATSRSRTAAARRSLEHVSLAVEPGAFVGIAGPNGGGKTTLLRLALGLERPSAGDRPALRRAARRARGPRVGYVPQRAQLASATPVTVREVVEAGRLAVRGPLGPLRADDRDAVEPGDRARRARRPRATPRCGRSPGGMQQRAFIARALAAEPALLALDEPTTGVDAESQESLAVLLAELRAELGVTILYVSHEFGAVEHVVSRLVLVRGRIVFDGDPAELPAALARPVPRPLALMLELEFMRLAFAVGAVVGVLAPAVGFFLVERRQSLVGDGLGHVAFAGVAAGYLLGVSPVLTALCFAVVGALAIEWLRSRGGSRRRPGARARLLHRHRARRRARLERRPARRRAVPVPVRLDPDGDLERPLGRARARARLARDDRGPLPRARRRRARRGGKPRRGRAASALLNTVVAVLAALTIGISMRIVGILLIAALMVLPVVAAQRVAWSLRSTLGARDRDRPRLRARRV